jgi:hypothetical protein
VLGENSHQYYFVHHKFQMSWPGIEQGPPATNCLSYNTGLF